MVVQPNVVSTLQPAGAGNVLNGVNTGFQLNNSNNNPLQKSGTATGLHQGGGGGGSNNSQSQSMSVHQQHALKQQQQEQQQQLLQTQQAQQQRLIQNQELVKQQLQQRQLQQQQQLFQQQQIQQQKNQAAQLQAFHAQQQQQQQPQTVDFNTDMKVDAIKVKQQAVKQVLMQQQIKQRHIQQQLQQQQQQQQQVLKVGSPQLVSSPQIMQAPSPQQQLSPQPDQSFAALPVVTKAVTPPFQTPSPSSTLPATPPAHDDSDTKVLVNNAAATAGGSLQALQPAMAAAVSNNAGPITTLGMAVSPLMADFSPAAHVQLSGATQETLQAFSPGTPLLDKSHSTEPPLERLMKKVCSDHGWLSPS
jgi:PAX-interacting protein 1